MAVDQFGDRHVDADMRVVMEDHPFRLHLLDAAIDVVLLHLEVGNAVAQQSAGFRVLLVDMHVMADARELLRGGEPRRTRADDRDALAGLALRRLGDDPALPEAAVDDGAFDRLDRDRLVFEVQRAGGLAGGGADASGELGEVVGGVEIDQRAAPVAVIDEVVPVRDLIVDRAAVVTIGNAAGHAARRLPPCRFLRQRDDEFVVMPNSVGGRLVFPVLPVDFKEARNLAHRSRHLRLVCRRPHGPPALI